MKHYRTISGFLVTIIITAGLASAGDWAQWRGPELNGSNDETNLPTEFSKENTAWTSAMPGESGATPIVVGDKIFLTSRKTKSEDLLGMCVSLKDGKTIWSKVMSSGKPASRAVASCSPASDGKSVYFLFGTGDLCATDMDGKILWSRKLAKDYGPFAIRFGYSASPLVRKGRLYIPLLRTAEGWKYTKGMKEWGKKPLDSRILCLDATDGKTIWSQIRYTDAKLDCKDTYITPMVVETKKGPELIMCGGEYVTGHNIDNGKELWRWEYTKTREVYQRIVSCPVIVDGLVITNQALGRATFALKPGGSGRIKHKDYVWKWSEKGSADVCSPLVYRGLMYILPGDLREKVITCLDPKTGKVKWQAPFKGKGPWRASPTGADGKIYCISKGGDYVVLEAGEKFKELHRTSVGAKKCMSTIVPANGCVLIRTEKDLICLKKAK
jgi:outer membrane protein assembly factor BamB